MSKTKNYLFLLIPIILLIALFMMKDPTEEEITYSTYQKSDLLKVYVFGEVQYPGEYYLKDGSTKLDLISKCGRTDYTSQTDLNLADKLINGSSYEVLMTEDSKKEVVVTMKVSTYIPNVELTSNDSSGLININEASLETLITLSGIGTARAESIINYRKTTKFSKVEDILEVSGISEKIYNAIKDFITV